MQVARIFAAVWLSCSGLCQFVAAQATATSTQDVVVVLDDSGSMGESMQTSSGRVRKITAAQDALTAVLAQLPAGTNVGVLAMNSQLNGSSWIIPLGPLERGGNWRNRIAQIQANGGTPLGEFLKQGADALLAARAARPYGNYRLLVVTDGEANDNELVDAFLPDILQRGIAVDVIGVDMQAEHSLARRAHSYRSAADDQSLQQAIQAVFAETSADDQTAATDFEMLSALPEEFAIEAVKALTQRNNDPIIAREDSSNEFAPNSTSYSSGGRTSSDTVFTGLLCCLCPFALLALMVTMMLLLRRPRRR